MVWRSCFVAAEGSQRVFAGRDISGSALRRRVVNFCSREAECAGVCLRRFGVVGLGRWRVWFPLHMFVTVASANKLAAGGRPSTWSPPGRPRGSRNTEKAKFSPPEAPQRSQTLLESLKISKKLQKNDIFFAPQVVGRTRVKPDLKVYGGANPLACASALCVLTPEQSEK